MRLFFDERNLNSKGPAVMEIDLKADPRKLRFEIRSQDNQTAFFAIAWNPPQQAWLWLDRKPSRNPMLAISR